MNNQTMAARLALLHRGRDRQHQPPRQSASGLSAAMPLATLAVQAEPLRPVPYPIEASQARPTSAALDRLRRAVGLPTGRPNPLGPPNHSAPTPAVATRAQDTTRLASALQDRLVQVSAHLQRTLERRPVGGACLPPTATEPVTTQPAPTDSGERQDDGSPPVSCWPEQRGGAPSLASRLDGLRQSAGLDIKPVFVADSPLQVERDPPSRELTEMLPGRLLDTACGPVHSLCERVTPEDRHGERPVGTVLARPPEHVAILMGDAEFAAFDPRRALFLDTECIGLGVGMANLAFLIGAAHFDGDTLVLEQWLLRDLEDEPGALRALADRMRAADWLVTFNGRTFDLPLLQARMRINGQPDPSGNLRHLDLLHASRRLYGAYLPDCKLQTLERRTLGFERVDDVPGAAVPERYLNYLRGGPAEPLVGVVEHNRHDIVSMVTLLDLLLERVACAHAEVLSSPERGLRLAKLATKIGALDYAGRVYEMAAAFPGTAEQGRVGLARVKRKRKRLRAAQSQ